MSIGKIAGRAGKFVLKNILVPLAIEQAGKLLAKINAKRKE